jgi:hypothetical protein
MIKDDKSIDNGNENLFTQNLIYFNEEFLFVVNFVDDPIGNVEFKTKNEIILESLTTIFGEQVTDL